MNLIRIFRRSCDLRILLLMSQLLLACTLFWGAPLNAQDSVCSKEMSDEDIEHNQDRLVAGLRLALFHGDIAETRTLYAQLDSFAKACAIRENPPLPWVYCDSACYREQAGYWLFQASDLPVLSATGTLTDGAEILKSAQQGIEAIDKAKEMLLKENPVNAGSDSAFNTYVKRTLALAFIEARLDMIMGDSAYQSASAAEASMGLDILVSQYVTREKGLEGRECASHLCEARKAYQNTFSVIIEAKGSLPRNNPDFASEENELLALESDLRARLQSLDGGMLFLGVDPNGFTTMTQADLLQILSRFAQKLDSVETKIAAFINEWKEVKARQEDRLDDRQREDRRYINQNDINIKMAQIAKMEQQAKDYGEEVARRIQTLKNERDDFQARSEIRRIRFEIDQMTKENQARQSEILDRKAKDILLTDLEVSQDKRADLRWMVHYQISLTALENQVRSLDAQKLEYEERTRKAENQKLIIANDNKKLKNDIDVLNNKIENFKRDRAKQEKLKGDVFNLKREAIVLNICQLELDLAYLGAKDGFNKYQPKSGGPGCTNAQGPSGDTLTKDEYLKELCKVKVDLANMQQEKGIYIAKAVLGLKKVPETLKLAEYKKTKSSDSIQKLEQRFSEMSVNEDKTLAKVAENMKEKRTKMTDIKKQELVDKKTFLEKSKADLEKRVTDIPTNIEKAKSEIQSYLTAIEGVAASTTEIIAGTNGGTVTSPLEKVKAAWQTFKELKELDTRRENFVREWNDRIGSIAADVAAITKATDENSEESTTKTEKEVEDQQFQQTMIQLQAQGDGDLFDAGAAHLKGVAENLDCSDGQNLVEVEKKRLIRDHDMQVLNLDAATAENDLIQGEIDNIDREIKSLEKQIENINTQTNSNEILAGNQNEDISLLGRLIAVVEAQKAAVDDTIKSIMGWNDEIRKITDTIVQQFAAKFRQIEGDAANAIEHLKELLAGAVSNAETSIAELEKIRENIKHDQDIVDEAIKNQKKAADKITAARDQVLNQSGVHLEGEKSKPANDDRFLATEELMTRLVRGIPDYISQKRNYLANVNFVLGRLRNRAQIVGALSGHGDVSDMPVYVNNSASLERVLGRVCSWSSRREDGSRECTPSMDSAYYDDHAVVGVHQSIVDVPYESALVAGINRGETVNFHVSAGIHSTSDMQERSYLSLGPDFTLPEAAFINSYLLDILLEARVVCARDQELAGDAKTTPIRMAMRHSGIGYVLDGAKEPRFAVSPERVRKGLVYNIDQTDNPDLNEDIRHLVSGGSWKESNLPQTDKDGNPLPFFGAPLFGDYKIQALAQGCAVHKLRIHFIHTVAE